ncbi:hypothetical protein RKE30_37240 [Streptomyces sp. Li-HN-5-11]|uniref:hypothetical protein n=1 Tax=Streptomyces sp. Li-HN-5-11 TaxID=3075432 RepID=UPI0028AC64FC|nr:hypothetical protein [Streptomyces sp. Li-HN-5-11]WNM35604.1 hypothetical protein RKE30_37240 [Streptomyces sp. Li-HN-5-11]
MHIPSRAARVLAVAALPLALAACGSSGSSGSSDSSGSKADSASSASPSKDPNAGLLTGTRLKKTLAPASLFPKGFVAVPDGASDSGDQFLEPKGGSTAKPDCTKLETTGWMSVTGAAGGVSYAQDDYMNKSKTAEIAEEVDEFSGSGATTALKDLRTVPAACAAFTDTEEHARVKAVGHTTAGLGDEAYTITLTSGVWDNGTTLLAAREGTAVVTVMSTAGSDNGAATAKKIAEASLASLKKTS